MLYTYGYNDTIYMYENGMFNPYMFINFLHKKLPEDILKQADLKMASSEFRNPKKNYAGRIHGLVENNEFIKMSYSHRKVGKVDRVFKKEQSFQKYRETDQ